MTSQLYDTIVIGGGPAAAAAAVYTARKKLKTLLITDTFGGQSLVSSGIENWIGEPIITGAELARKLEDHVRAQEGVDIKMFEKVVGAIGKKDCTFEVTTDKDNSYHAKTLVIASGALRRRLKVPGEVEFDGKGVAFCSTCDAPLFQDQEVAVVGGGNAALETVIDLLAYARQVYLLWRDPIQADPVTEEKVRKASMVNIIGSVEVEEIMGDQSVTGVRYRDMKTSETRELTVSGVFVEIGSVPNSEFARDLVETNQNGEIAVDHKTGETSMEGVFAAGDVTTDPYKQNNIAAGDGVRAALSAYYYLLDTKKHSPCSIR